MILGNSSIPQPTTLASLSSSMSSLGNSIVNLSSSASGTYATVAALNAASSSMSTTISNLQASTLASINVVSSSVVDLSSSAVAAYISKSLATTSNQSLYSTAAGTWGVFSILSGWRSFLGTTKATWDETNGNLSLTGSPNQTPLSVYCSGTGELPIKVRNTSGLAVAGSQAGFDFGFSDAARVTFAVASTTGVGALWNASAYFYSIGMTNGIRIITSDNAPFSVYTNSTLRLSIGGAGTTTLNAPMVISSNWSSAAGLLDIAGIDTVGNLAMRLRNNAGTTGPAQCGIDYGFSDYRRITLAVGGDNVGGSFWNSSAYMWSVGNTAGMHLGTSDATRCSLWTNGTERFIVDSSGRAYNNGNIGAQVSVPTAKVHIAAGSSAASTAPIKLSTGALMSSPEAGAIEFLTDDLYFTITTGTSRKGIALTDEALTSGLPVYATTNGRITTATPGATYENVITKTVFHSPYSIANSDSTVLLNCTNGNILINLPSGSISTSRVLTFIKIDNSANSASIDGNASETINGSLTYDLISQYGSVSIICSGSAWYIK